MRRMLALLAVAFGAPAFAEDKPKDEWVPLFNGKNLDGWTPKIKGYELGDNHANTFRVEDGLLKVRYDKYEKFDENFGHLFFKESYSHYRIRVEYRFVGDQVKGGPGWAIRNSGIMIHGQDPKTMAKEQKFPVSIEVQLLGGNGKDPRPTGNLCTPGTNVVFDGKLHLTHCTNSKSKTFPADEWVTCEAEVHGSGKVTHYVNGDAVIEYEQCQYDERDPEAKLLIRDKKLLIEGGTISLQSESHPIDFRKVEIMILEKQK